ncbi:MAG: hypothetical protein IPJ00_11060 [Saprospirales bacterium]|nr:hypothetical protein [Saprospirales bacterium]
MKESSDKQSRNMAWRICLPAYQPRSWVNKTVFESIFNYFFRIVTSLVNTLMPESEKRQEVTGVTPARLTLKLNTNPAYGWTFEGGPNLPDSITEQTDFIWLDYTYGSQKIRKEFTGGEERFYLGVNKHHTSPTFLIPGKIQAE